MKLELDPRDWQRFTDVLGKAFPYRERIDRGATATPEGEALLLLYEIAKELLGRNQRQTIMLMEQYEQLVELRLAIRAMDDESHYNSDNAGCHRYVCVEPELLEAAMKLVG